MREVNKLDKWTYNPYYDKQNHPFCRLKLLIEKCGHSKKKNEVISQK